MVLPMVHVCYKCIGDSYLSDEIRTEGKRALCEFCGKKRRAHTLDALSQRVRDVIESHYSPHQDEYGADNGEPVLYLILNLLACEESVAEAVREHISQTTAWEAHDGGYSDPFGSETCYIERPADIHDLQETWGFFRSEIRSRSRYFSETARHALQEIFGDLTTLTNWSREPVIQTIGTGTEMTDVYRGRIAFSEAELETILKEPVVQLGPPPTAVARAGRMNAKGISVFYGALEDATCLAEVRAPVGSQVVIGRFQMLREFRVLDLSRLAGIYTSVSEFDPRFDLMVGRSRFFERLVQEISRPVMPRDEEDEYLVTQAVAEFLASSVKPQLDGILFDSAQKPHGHNLVLFHRAANVEPYDLPVGATVQVRLGWSTDDDFDDGISVWETTKRPPLKTTIPKPQPKALSRVPDFAALIAPQSAYDETAFFTYMAPDLRLDVNAMIVHRIASVQYDAPTRRLHRYREQEGEMDEVMGDPATFVYFAYGSNMSSERLRFRVSSCRPLGLATLVGHVLRFHKASIDKSSKCNAYATGNPDDVVVGVLYSIRRSQKVDLDTAEGLGKGYDDAIINVIASDGTVVEAMTYFAKDNAIDENLGPYTWYKDFVEEGAAEHHLPQLYVNKHIAPIVAVTDSDKKREKRRRAERASLPKFGF